MKREKKKKNAKVKDHWLPRPSLTMHGDVVDQI